ncbi:MAG: hypothetical protein JWQ21_3695 [Herminiimonas sp.]|nr:hypothetical protein [Herminiimonas sp.]
MQMPFFFNRTPAPAAGTLYFLLAACLAGCASTNPLMQEPVAAVASQTKPAAAPVQGAQPASAANTGVQTIKQQRFLGFLSPYRSDIQQGNFVSQEMVSQLKEGMTPDQVRFVLGTPLLIDLFHESRWDYVFRLQKGNGEVTSSRVTVFFKDNRVARFEGGDLPTEKDYLARLASAPSETRASTPAAAPQPAPSSASEPK